MKRAAVLCASGIGDGLLMMIAAHNLKKKGYIVTIFHNANEALSPLFAHAHFSPYPPLEHLTSTLKPFDRVLAQNDNSERSWHLFKDRETLPQLSFFFPPPPLKSKKRTICSIPVFQSLLTLLKDVKSS